MRPATHLGHRARSIALTLAAIATLATAASLALAHPEHDAPAAGAIDPNAPKRPSPQTAKLIGLSTHEADFGSVEQVLRLTGVCRFMPEAVRAIASPAPGTITRVLVRQGQLVESGAVLAEVSSPEVVRLTLDLFSRRAELEQARAQRELASASLANLRAQAEAAESQRTLAEQDLDRVRSAGEAVPTSTLTARQSALLTARAQHAAAVSALAQAEGQVRVSERAVVAGEQAVALMTQGLTSLGVTDLTLAPSTDPSSKAPLGTLRLISPARGVVVNRPPSPGQVVQAGEGSFVIADDAQMLVEAELPESLIATARQIPAGGVARVRRIGSAGDQPALVGAVLGLAPTVDPVKRTTHLLIRVDRPEKTPSAKLSDGQFVSVHAVVRSVADAVVVPKDAVLSDGPARFVFIKSHDGSYVRKDIVTGQRDDRVVEVIDGVVPGDQVVVGGAYALTQLRPQAEPHDEEHHHDH